MKSNNVLLKHEMINSETIAWIIDENVVLVGLIFYGEFQTISHIRVEIEREESVGVRVWI